MKIQTNSLNEINPENEVPLRVKSRYQKPERRKIINPKRNPLSKKENSKTIKKQRDNLNESVFPLNGT